VGVVIAANLAGGAPDCGAAFGAQLRWVPLSGAVIPVVLETLSRIPMAEDFAENRTAVTLLCHVFASRSDDSACLAAPALQALVRLGNVARVEPLDVGPAVSVCFAVSVVYVLGRGRLVSQMAAALSLKTDMPDLFADAVSRLPLTDQCAFEAL
jgi:hypothetical protein